MIYSGVIGRVGEKQFNGKTFYSFTLKGQEGWYNTGVKKPYSEGTTVKFEAAPNQKGYLTVSGSLEVLKDGEPGSAGTVAQTVSKDSGSGSRAGGVYWDRKEARDIVNDAARELGASRNTAISIIDLGLRNEVYKLPAAAKREEFFFTLLDRITNRLMGGEVETKDKPAEEQATTNDPESDKWS